MVYGKTVRVPYYLANAYFMLLRGLSLREVARRMGISYSRLLREMREAHLYYALSPNVAYARYTITFKYRSSRSRVREKHGHFQRFEIDILMQMPIMYINPTFSVPVSILFEYLLDVIFDACYDWCASYNPHVFASRIVDAIRYGEARIGFTVIKIVPEHESEFMRDEVRIRIRVGQWLDEKTVDLPLEVLKERRIGKVYDRYDYVTYHVRRLRELYDFTTFLAFRGREMYYDIDPPITCIVPELNFFDIDVHELPYGFGDSSLIRDLVVLFKQMGFRKVYVQWKSSGSVHIAVEGELPEWYRNVIAKFIGEDKDRLICVEKRGTYYIFNIKIEGRYKSFHVGDVDEY